MATLEWGTAGTRLYETGIDRGVLYVGNGEYIEGVPWNGLISVSESSSGGEPTPFYADGIKYANMFSSEEFQATIEAYTSPPAFDACDGTGTLMNGLFVSQQPRVPFALSYRTMIGNDVVGTELGYKIHLIYGAMASPAERSNATVSDSPEAMTLSWEVTTTPPRLAGIKPSAHFVVDSRHTPASLLVQIENILYGTATSQPRLLTAREMVYLATSYAEIELIAEHDNGTSYSDIVMSVYIAPTEPFLLPGEEIMWFDTSGGDYASLNIVTGE